MKPEKNSIKKKLKNVDEIKDKQLIPDLKEFKDKTIGDVIDEYNDLSMDHFIFSGELFTIDIYDLIRLMDNKSKIILFDRIDQLSILDLVVDHKLDFTLVKKWLDRYIYCRILWQKSNNQVVSQSNTSQQVVLYYYLKKLSLINLDIIVDETKKSELLSILLNRDTSNIRKALREVNIKESERKYLTKSNLKKLLELAEVINYPDLINLIKRDIERLYP